ncbi:MAG: AAA family ATPase [Acidimicrobiia bacterium]
MSKGPRLIIVCGLPGAGKTTHGKTLAAELDAIRFSPDEWMKSLGIDLWDETARARIEAVQWELAQDLMRLGQTAIIEWGTWAKDKRDTLREAARKLGASVELHYLEQPIDVLWQRIDSRSAESPPVKRSDLEIWAENFEPPRLSASR